jgi:hypothetical protein
MATKRIGTVARPITKSRVNLNHVGTIDEVINGAKATNITNGSP